MFSMMFALILAVSGFALDVKLTAVQYPEKVDVDIPFTHTDRAPNGQLEAEVTYEQGQARIELQFKDMKAPVLFGGDVTAYVLWAVTRDGIAENLGELYIDEGSGKAEYSTGQKNFAMIVTAETHFLVTQPSELLLHTSEPADNKRASNSTFIFSGFAPAPDHDLESIAHFEYKGDMPLELMQAEKTYALAEENDALTYASDIMRDAKITLAQARGLSKEKRNRKGMVDYARRSVALSSEAIRITERKIEAERLAEEIARRRAEMEALQSKVEQAQAARETAEQQKAQLLEDMSNLSREIQSVREERESLAERVTEAQAAVNNLKEEQASIGLAMEQLRESKAELESQKADLEASMVNLEERMNSLKEEKAKLSQRLEGALKMVADTNQSARGLIVNLPDILFDFNKATLKDPAKITLAKLAGILIIMPELNLRVEGHTDSIGTKEYNLKLSEQRADSVLQFLKEQGVDAGRMIAAGYGMERPRADNATDEGRAKNRRVEIVIAEGVVQEAQP